MTVAIEVSIKATELIPMFGGGDEATMTFSTGYDPDSAEGPKSPREAVEEVTKRVVSFLEGFDPDGGPFE